MISFNFEQAQSNLASLIDQTAISHEPIQISGVASNGVLISEDDWRSMQETLYLLSIPGMRESIRNGVNTPPEQCSSEPGWISKVNPCN